jgi:SpoVK/Ycf46/Vps4 family AAA+-type ATPase
MGKQATENDPQVSQFRRWTTAVSDAPVLHRREKDRLISTLPIWHRKEHRRRLEAEWQQVEQQARRDADKLAAAHQDVVKACRRALERLLDSSPARLKGKVDDELAILTRAEVALTEVRRAGAALEIDAAGRAMVDADRQLWPLGRQLTVAVTRELKTAAFSRELQAELASNQAERRRVRLEAERLREGQARPAMFAAAVASHHLMAEGIELLAQVLGQQTESSDAGRRAKIGADNALRLIPPQDLERFDEVGGLEQVKLLLRRSLSAQLESRDEAVRYGVQQNTVLLYGPPGTGKTLLARAVAGQYGLRFLRMAPAVIASPYPHETARNLARVFETAAESAPCLLFLDEVDSLGSARSGLPSAEHRELVTQLMTLLEEYRGIPGLVIMGATNALELLDPAMREGRFDTKIPVPLPDTESRVEILEIHLRRRSETVAWDDLDLLAVARGTAGRSGATLATLVSMAAEKALAERREIAQTDLMGAIREREARDRTKLEQPVTWSDVVLTAELEERLRDLMELLQHPEMAEALGITPPPGVVLYGPPGTGKTTIAKALATEVRASFYEMSAADVMSKWVGESEERVAKLFSRARETRPSIVFIDEIDALLKRRTVSSVAPWEERLVSQFLRELDGLQAATGVFLVGATNRLDIIDEAVTHRRLTPIEVGLPDVDGRRRLLELLFAKTPLADDVDVAGLASETEGLSGADLKRMRDEVGLKALSSGVRAGRGPDELVVTSVHLNDWLKQRRKAVSPLVAGRREE